MSALVENPAGAGSQDIVRATGATHHPRVGDKATLESAPGTEVKGGTRLRLAGRRRERSCAGGRVPLMGCDDDILILSLILLRPSTNTNGNTTLMCFPFVCPFRFPTSAFGVGDGCFSGMHVIGL